MKPIDYYSSTYYFYSILSRSLCTYTNFTRKVEFYLHVNKVLLTRK